MNLQQGVQPRSSANGYGRRRERESLSWPEQKSLSGKTNPSRLANAGVLAGSKSGGYESLSRERIVYLTTCLIGHNVEVQVGDGSLFAGIFHATNAEKDFGIILRMARTVRSGSSQGQKSMADSISKAPSKTLIIPAKDLVQITAKGVSVTRDGFTNDLQHVKQQDIMLDSSISQSYRVEVERELERWVPDEDVPQCPELENTFDGQWNRGWDQFEANETLFGVKSTFDEELYTTKLERGPLMRELEREASRIAGEIEGEDTQDLHLAEERGINLHENLDIDEETRFSSVFRGVDDSGYDEDEDLLLDSHNTETFSDASGSVVSTSFANLFSGNSNDRALVSSCSSSVDEVRSSLTSSARDLHHADDSSDYSRQLSSEFLSKSSALDSERRIQENQFSEQHAEHNYIKEFVEKPTLAEEAQTSKSEELQPSLRENNDGSDVGELSSNAASYASTSLVSSKGQEKMSSPSELTQDAACVKPQGATQSARSRGRPGSTASSTSEWGGAASASSGPGLSPSSSMGSLSSEKSTLNPHAKEFKLNPNAKSFIPSQTPLRPASPVSDGSYYFQPNAAAVPHMHGMPVGIGVGPSFAHPPVMFNPQVTPMQSPQAYFHPNGPQYGQQMILGHPRQVLYMPAYPPEMPYKGRDF